MPRLHQSCFKSVIHLNFLARSLIHPSLFFFPGFFQLFSPLSISRWYSHLKAENTTRKNKRGDARTRGGKNTKHWWVLNTNPRTDAAVHAHTKVYISTYHLAARRHAHTRTHTRAHTLLGISRPLGAGWIEYICTSGLNTEDYGGYEGNA